MVRIAVAGSLNYDLLAYVPHLPRPGEAVHAHEVRRSLGGKGFNQAVAARRLDASVELLGAIGDDAFGAEFQARLDQLGIGRGGVRRLEAPTGMAIPVVDQEGENCIVVALGANLGLLPDMLDAARLDADAVLVQGEMRADTSRKALELGRGLRLLNAAPASRELEQSVPLADVVVVNEGEAADLGGPERLRSLGARAVVVTLGARGAMVGSTLIPAPRIEAVDSTGAGDAFCAALAVALAEGQPLESAVAWANRAGAAACLVPGTSAAMPTRAQVEAVPEP